MDKTLVESSYFQLALSPQLPLVGLGVAVGVGVVTGVGVLVVVPDPDTT